VSTCLLCNGRGYIKRTHAHPQNPEKTDVCPVCKGKGKVDIVPTSKQQIVLYADYRR